MSKYFLFVFIFFFYHVNNSYAELINTQTINSARKAVSLPVLQHNQQLFKAADAHASYLNKHLSLSKSQQVSAHTQQPQKNGFTGRQAAQRAQYFHYPHTQVFENISLGNTSVYDSISGLMAAVYHRFTFLNFDVDEIGAARVKNRYVYNLGINDLKKICTNTPAEARPKAPTFCGKQPCVTPSTAEYYKICTNGFQINVPFYKQLQASRLAKKPLAVIWPPNGAAQIPPVFYEETPHPTPDLAMSGYPISLQINSSKAQLVTITNFKLEQFNAFNQQWSTVTGIRQIDHGNDVNNQFSAWQFAWFPLQRLEWNTPYRYQVSALIDNTPYQWNVNFKTSVLPAPMINVLDHRNIIEMQTDHVVLYRPNDGYDAFPFKAVDLRFDSRLQVKTNVIDANTLEIKVSGRSCLPILITTRLGDEMKIKRCIN